MRTTFYAVGHVSLDMREHVALRVNIRRYEYKCNTLIDINIKSSNVYRISRLRANRKRREESIEKNLKIFLALASKSRPRD